MTEVGNFISLPKAADIAGVSPRTLIRMIEEGAVKGHKPRKHWRIDSSSLNRHLAGSSRPTTVLTASSLDYNPFKD